MSSKTKSAQLKKHRRKRSNTRLAQLMAEKREFRCPSDVYEMMTENYTDVLQNIEMGINLVWRNNKTIDDRDVTEALKANIRGDTLTSGKAQRIQESLADARELRSDISNELWRNGLFVVLESVGNHSSLIPGERGYLRFVDEYLL